MYNNFKRTEILYYGERQILQKDINIFKLFWFKFVIRPSNEKFNSMHTVAEYHNNCYQFIGIRLLFVISIHNGLQKAFKPHKNENN